jgi:putative transcriptional regulator
MGALEVSRRGKRALRTHAVVFRPAPELTADELVRVRERLNLSRGVFAAYLRTNVRTLENWEQGRARPNAQAALLIHLVKRYPDTVERLAALQGDRGQFRWHSPPTGSSTSASRSR